VSETDLYSGSPGRIPPAARASHQLGRIGEARHLLEAESREVFITELVHCAKPAKHGAASGLLAHAAVGRALPSCGRTTWSMRR
jgi:hypothetical protein